MVSGGGRRPPDHRCNEMGVRWRWCDETVNGREEGQEGKESKSICSGGRSLICGSPARNWAAWRSATHISPGPGPWRAAEEMGHRVVGGVTFRVIGPDYGVAVGLEPWKVAGSDLRKGASVWPGQKLFGWVNWRWGWPWALCWVPETGRPLLSSDPIRGVWARGKRLLQHATKDERKIPNWGQKYQVGVKNTKLSWGHHLLFAGL